VIVAPTSLGIEVDGEPVVDLMPIEPGHHTVQLLDRRRPIHAELLDGTWTDARDLVTSQRGFTSLAVSTGWHGLDAVPAWSLGAEVARYTRRGPVGRGWLAAAVDGHPPGRLRSCVRAGAGGASGLAGWLFGDALAVGPLVGVGGIYRSLHNDCEDTALSSGAGTTGRGGARGIWRQGRALVSVDLAAQGVLVARPDPTWVVGPLASVGVGAAW